MSSVVLFVMVTLFFSTFFSKRMVMYTTIWYIYKNFLPGLLVDLNDV